MAIFLGNIQFHQVESELGYRLTDSDKAIWDEFHNDNANLAGMDQCFHVFDMPRMIACKGADAMAAVLQIFTEDKLVKACGRFEVGMWTQDDEQLR